MDLLVDADILACQFAYAYETNREGDMTIYWTWMMPVGLFWGLILQ